MTSEDTMVDRNIEGMALEKAGKIDEAITLYEANIKDKFDGSHPYERLRVLYDRQGKIKDAVRVCKAYITSKKTHDQSLKSKMSEWIEKHQ